APAVDMRTPGGKKARPAHGTLRRIFPPPNRRKPVGTAPNRPAHAGSLIFEQIRNKIGCPLVFNGLWLLPNRNKRGTKNIGRLARWPPLTSKGCCIMAQNTLRLVEDNSVDKTKALDAA